MKGGGDATLFILIFCPWIVGFLALVALGLAFFPSKRRAAVWVGWIALAAGLVSAVPFLYVSGAINARQVQQQNELATGPSSYQGIPLSEWVRRYASPDVNFEGVTVADREQAADAIRHIGAEALPLLLDFYQPKAQPFAFCALGSIAAPAIPELTRRVNHPIKSFARMQAMLALCCLGPSAEPAMRAEMCSPEWASLPLAAESIRILGTDARPLVPLLVQYLRHPDPKVAMSAANSLAFLKYKPNLVVPILVKSLDYSDVNVRRRAVNSLMAYGELACAAVVPALAKVLRDDDQGLAVYAVGALGKLKCKPDLIVSALVKGLEHPGPYVRGNIVKALATLGKPALPALRKALNDSDSTLRERAKDAIQKIAPETQTNAPPQ